jgi:adenylate cyclase
VRAESQLGDLHDDPLAAELLRSRQERGSLAIVYAGLVILAITAPFVVFVSATVNARLGVGLAAIWVVFLVYELIMLQVFRRGLYRPWLDWVNGTIEVSSGVAIMVVDAELEGIEYALTSAPPYLFPIIVMASAVRLRRSLSLYTGVLAGSCYLGVYALYRDDMAAGLGDTIPSFAFWNIGQRALFIAFAGFVAYLVCQLMRRSYRELVANARDRARIERTLGRHVSREVANLLVESDAEWLGDERDVTVLFADLRRFTAFSEARVPTEVVAFLNDYFDLAADAIERHGGIVNKFTGDGLMALFGAPAPDDDHPTHAARAACDILAGLEALRERWNDPSLRIGIGIHSGPAVVGTVGTTSRAEYTAIGDTVNVAARIEELTKQFDAEILVSDETAGRLPSTTCTTRVDEVPIRGRRSALVIHRLDAAP